MEQAAGEAADVADAQNRTGNRHGQHGDRLDKALGLELFLDHQIGDDHGQQRRDGRGDQRQDEGVLERLQALILGEDLSEPLEGQRAELVAPCREQRADGGAQVHHDHEDRRQRAKHRQRNGHRLIGDEHSCPGRLARQGRGGFGLQIVFLDGEHQQRNAQQHHSHRRSALFVIRAGDLQINGRRQRIVGAADDHGVGKVSDGLNEGHQKRVAKSRKHQRERDGREHLPPGSAHIPGGLLQRGVDILQQTLEHHVAHREECQRLDDGDAPEAIYVVIVYFQQEPGDQSRLAEQHDHGQ